MNLAALTRTGKKLTFSVQKFNRFIKLLRSSVDLLRILGTN